MTQNFINWISSKIASININDVSQSYQRVRYDCPGLSSANRDNDNVSSQIQLKYSVSRLLCGSFENWEIDKWIVHTWGGITKFGVDDTDQHKQRIINFKNSLERGSMTRAQYGTISSVSKIASFVKPDEYFVYDSRVAFALDGLMLEFLKENPNESVQFFPIPSANSKYPRNRRMDVEIRNRKPDAECFSVESVYHEYCTLIKAIHECIKPQITPACKVEMILFHLGRTGGEIDQMYGWSEENGFGVYSMKSVCKPAPKKSPKEANAYTIKGNRSGYYITPTIEHLVDQTSEIRFKIGESKTKKSVNDLKNFIKRGTFQRDEQQLIDGLRSTNQDLTVLVDKNDQTKLITIKIKVGR